MSEDTPTIKVVMFGSMFVGKTTLVSVLLHTQNRRVDPMLLHQNPTLGVAQSSVFIELDDDKYSMIIADTAGQEMYKSLGKQFARDAKAAMLVFDFSSRKTFEDLPEWVDLLSELNIPFVLVGNKDDLPKQVTVDEANEFATSYGAFLYGTSAVTYLNVEEAFAGLLITAIQQPTQKHMDGIPQKEACDRQKPISLKENDQTSDSSCC